MAITVRKGYENQFDSNKMLPGEFAVTTDTHKVYVCMAAGISKELASVEELQSILGASDEAFQAFQELINAMESGTVITGLLTDVNNLKSGEYTISFSEAETRENIETTDTIKVIFGKIKKFFSSLAAVAFSGSYADLENAPNFQTGIDANAEAISELNTKLGAITTQYFTINDDAFWLVPGTYILLNDYGVSGTGEITLSIYNFTKGINLGYAYGLSSPSGARGNMVRIAELTESTQIGIHATGTLSKIGAQFTAIRIK